MRTLIQKLFIMKKFSKSLLCLFMAIPLVFTSCGGDDDATDESSENTALNQFSYDGETYDINTAIIEGYGMYGDNYNFDLSLTDATITNEDGEPSTTDTNFTGIYFEMFTDNPNQLEPGTYTYIGETEENWGAAFSFDYADITFVESVDEEDYTYYEFTDGTVTIADDNTFEVEFTATDDNGNTVEGYYKGDTMNFDYEDETGRPASLQTKKRGFLK